MRMKSAAEIINEDLNITVGTGVTCRSGSDSYPYYVSEVLPNGVFGLYHAPSKWDEKHPWEGGTQVVDPFDPNHKSEFFIKRRYGRWWGSDRTGKNVTKHCYGLYGQPKFGYAHAYQDPSF